jgi:hypothetical protein
LVLVQAETDQWTRIESPKIDQIAHGNLVVDKDGISK